MLKEEAPKEDRLVLEFCSKMASRHSKYRRQLNQIMRYSLLSKIRKRKPQNMVEEN
jgi:hypothetical protein